MKELDPSSQERILAWRPAVVRHETGESSIHWKLKVESPYLTGGEFTKKTALNYKDVQVMVKWDSAQEVSLVCRTRGEGQWKDLYDSGYRGVLAIDRFVGCVYSLNGINRSMWWVAIFTLYCAFDGPRKYDINELMKAAGANNFLRVENLLTNGEDIEASDMIGVTALSCAAESGAVQSFNVLLGSGANAKTTTSGGGTLLHAAAAGGSVEILSTLVKLGLDLNAQAQSGHTALGWSIIHSKPEAAKYLLSAGADPYAERGIELCREAQLRFGEQHPVTSLLCR